MAILDFLPGVSVTVCVGNVPLTEYPDPSPNLDLIFAIDAYKAAKTVTHYIEAVSDSDFTVDLVVKPPYVHDCANIGFSVCVDGALVGIFLCSGRRYRQMGTWKDTVFGDQRMTAEGAFLRNFRFATINTTDESDGEKVRREKRRLEKCGEIIIEVHRNKVAKRVPAAVEEKLEGQVETDVPEGALKGKGISHGTTYGPAIDPRPRSYWTCDYRDGVDFPIAIFKFKYRSRETLKQLQIIPRTPLPEPMSERVKGREFPSTPSFSSSSSPPPSLPSLVSSPVSIMTGFSKLTPEQQTQLLLIIEKMGVTTSDSPSTTSEAPGAEAKGVKRERDYKDPSLLDISNSATLEPDRKKSRTGTGERKYKETVVVDLTADDGGNAILVD